MRVWKQCCAVFRSWIKPGQRPRGLQVNVAYFKRLFLHGHSVSEAHLHAKAFWEKQKRITARKSLRMWFTHLFISVCFAKSASGLSLRFPFFPSFSWVSDFYSLFRTSVMLSAFYSLTPPSLCSASPLYFVNCTCKSSLLSLLFPLFPSLGPRSYISAFMPSPSESYLALY